MFMLRKCFVFEHLGRIKIHFRVGDEFKLFDDFQLQDIVKSRPLLLPITLQEIKKYQQACTNKKVNDVMITNFVDFVL